MRKTLPCGLLAIALAAWIVAHPAMAEQTGVQTGEQTAQATVRWSGRTWIVRDSTGGPGPNTFSPRNVEARQDETLHLFLRPTNGHWSCAELYTTESLGRGTYEFELVSRVDRFDPNVVLGLFSYPDAEVGPDGTNELDIEFARWGHADWPNGNYTAYPRQPGGKDVSCTFEFKQPTGRDSTIQRYTWQRLAIRFETLVPVAGQAPSLTKQWTTPGRFASQVARKAMPVHLNLWLFNGKPPADRRPVEVVIRAFRFTPEK